MNTAISPRVVAKWTHLYSRCLTDKYCVREWLLPLVDTIIEHRIMPFYGLYPFTSHAVLRFSRTTIYPYATWKCPHVLPIAEGIYRVMDSPYRIVVRTHYDSAGNESKRRCREHDVLGEGCAEEAVRLLLGAFPHGCGTAVDMAGDDLYRLKGIGLVDKKDIQLEEATHIGDREAILDALQAGADVNAANEHGWTPLMFAIFGGHTEIVRLLLEKGACVYQESSGRESALALAQFEGDKYPQILRLVEQARQN